MHAIPSAPPPSTPKSYSFSYSFSISKSPRVHRVQARLLPLMIRSNQPACGFRHLTPYDFRHRDLSDRCFRGRDGPLGRPRLPHRRNPLSLPPLTRPSACGAPSGHALPFSNPEIVLVLILVLVLEKPNCPFAVHPAFHLKLKLPTSTGALSALQSTPNRKH